MFALLASMSGIISVLLLAARRFGRSLWRNGYKLTLNERCCNVCAVCIDAIVASLAGTLCKEDTRTVVMVLAFVALVAFPFQEVFAEKRHVGDRFLAWRAWLAAASCAFAAS